MSKPKTESCETLRPALKDPAAATVAALLLIVQLQPSQEPLPNQRKSKRIHINQCHRRRTLPSIIDRLLYLFRSSSLCFSLLSSTNLSPRYVFIIILSRRQSNAEYYSRNPIIILQLFRFTFLGFFFYLLLLFSCLATLWADYKVTLPTS
jgi:hypothetical protein